MMSEEQGKVKPAKAMRRPPAMVIRPTRAEAERDPAAFYELLESVQDFANLSNSRIAKIIGDETLNSTVNVWKRIDKEKLTDKARLQILAHIFDEAKLLSREHREAIAPIPDALYFAFLNYCDVKETSQDTARARIVGTYKLWRFSVEHESEFVMGRLDFKEDPKTRAVKVRMVQRRQPVEGVPGVTERFAGYLFRISHMHLMLVRDEITNDFRMTLFPRSKTDIVGRKVNPKSAFQGERLHIVQMDGFGLGIDGSSGFFSPVHLTLVDDIDELAALDDNLDVMQEGDKRLPERIVVKLKRNGPLRRL